MVNSKCAEVKERAIVLMMLGEVHDSILLYRGTDHGWTADDFLSRIEGRESTLTLLKIKDGDCIGGFTKKKWYDKFSNSEIFCC
jgi:hypothetical protein